MRMNINCNKPWLSRRIFVKLPPPQTFSAKPKISRNFC